ncbi:MAG: DnaB-like helicase C-terminal domain-containing protein, partial [Bacteroidales bacterium]|nr:DnaB-like helicase C-terminal domain-containing protein [Bacteroidales bacterium]
RRLSRQCGKLGLIVVDYLQLMSGSGSDGDNRASELGEISRGLKMLAKELQCPVIALSQLNRSVETRTDKRPMMSDLRESGAIEQDADMVIFIYRPEYYGLVEDENNNSLQGLAVVNIAKHRNGKLGDVNLKFIGTYAKFEDPENFDKHPQELMPNTSFELPTKTISSRMNDEFDVEPDYNDPF